MSSRLRQFRGIGPAMEARLLAAYKVKGVPASHFGYGAGPGRNRAPLLLHHGFIEWMYLGLTFRLTKKCRRIIKLQLMETTEQLPKTNLPPEVTKILGDIHRIQNELDNMLQSFPHKDTLRLVLLAAKRSISDADTDKLISAINELIPQWPAISRKFRASENGKEIPEETPVTTSEPTI